jgi:glycerate kinase
MNLLFASDSFKGTLSSRRTIELLTEAAQEVFGSCAVRGVPVADGGEGTVDAVVSACGGRKVNVTVHDPLMKCTEAYFGIIGEGEAVIEMAQASGLALIPDDQKNPLYTSTYGTGELVMEAVRSGCRKIALAIGGSATNDGGMGFASALGVRFLDTDGRILAGKGIDLEKVADIDISAIPEEIRSTHFTVMCDVTNPLCGKDGATFTFGKQKGGTPEILNVLESGMCNYRDLMIRKFGINPDDIPGAGAAGGLGAALRILFGAEMKSGIESVLDMVQFDSLLKDTDLVVTGEGRTDWQSCFGKVMQGVGPRARKYGVQVVALCGSLGEGYEDVYQYGIDSIMTTVDAPMELAEALDRADELYYKGAIRLFRMIRAGRKSAVY